MAGQWCSWITTRSLDQLRGMYGTLDAEFEVQRTIQRVELTAFLFLLWRIVDPTTAHLDNKGIIGLERRNEVHWPYSERS